MFLQSSIAGTVPSGLVSYPVPPGAGCVTPASHVYGHLRLMTNLSGLRCIIPPRRIMSGGSMVASMDRDGSLHLVLLSDDHSML